MLVQWDRRPQRRDRSGKLGAPAVTRPAPIVEGRHPQRPKCLTSTASAPNRMPVATCWFSGRPFHPSRCAHCRSECSRPNTNQAKLAEAIAEIRGDYRSTIALEPLVH
jgi:hypothetical protein